MVSWYRDTLGFTVFAQGTVGQRNIRYALLKQDTALLEIVQWPDARPLKQAAPATSDPVEIHGFFKSGVVVTDVRAVHDRLQALGVAFDYDLQEHPGGYRSFGIRDPEGNLLQIFGM
jgi:catechol 2,3-dioxygenase-like lactoylglutathione lyase family enzyme